MIKLTSTIQGYCAQSGPIVVLVFVWSQRGICVQKGAGMWLIQVSYTYMQECMYKFKDKWNLKTNWHILYIHMQIYIFWGTVPVRLQWTLSCYHPTICIYVCVCICICTWNTVPSTIESLSSKYLESSSYRSTISQLKSLRTLGWMWDPLTIVYNYDDDDDNYDTVLMMKGVELGEKKWNPRQLHCLLNLDNLSPGRADGKINWKWIWNAEIQICVRGRLPPNSQFFIA